MRTGEIVRTLVDAGAKVCPNDKNTKYLLKNYKGQGGESRTNDDHAISGADNLDSPALDEPQPPSVAGRFTAGVATLLAAALDEVDEGDDAGEGAATVEGGGGEWDSKKHSDMWGYLSEFYKKPGRNENDRKDDKMWRTVATDDESRLNPADWWAAHGGDVPDLQAIAIKVMGMWSTTTPAERNWASMDFVHSKRRNRLSSESLEKLVYIHWNMQLLRVPNNKDSGYIDVWGSFFEPDQEPVPDDGSVLSGRAEDAAEKEEEERRQRTLAKAPRGRIPKNLSDSDWSDSSDLADLIWKDKCWNESSSEDCSEEEVGDSDFELDAVPAIRATTYVGRRLGRRERDLEVEPAPTVDRLDTDVATLLRPMVDADKEEAAKAKAMADKEVHLVNRRIREEEARRVVVPTRRERERQARQQDQLKGQHMEDVEGGGGEKTEMPVEAGNMMQVEGEEAEGADDVHMQHERGDLEAAQETNEPHTEQIEEAVEVQPPIGVVYKRRPRPQALQEVEAVEKETGQQAEHAEKQQEQEAAKEISMSPMPAMTEAVQHDNLWKSRAGRKRKARVETKPSAPRRGRGRPKKMKTVATSPKQKGRRPGKLRKGQNKARKGVAISYDDPDSVDDIPQSSDEGCTPDEYYESD
ncbi:hypothetical protein CBR_g30162 [Chara braunii]|uniref:HAT C-terminal dimerisation domain-containing protein n=1 Tax=Chara braunii TaxID=69332 RepID=A0A388LC43_CHABU|nr:hypothetical protein CBR_g30162 [Chara braunii]|eukprot:GBG79897.1 hypothetical protein CBR_g30162 [Chara braunii]